MHRLLLAAIFASSLWQSQTRATASSILFAGTKAELALSEISERTVRLQLAFIDDKQIRTPASTVLAPFASIEKLRIRELDREKQIQVGGLRVTLKSSPLSISVRRADGKLVQHLIFDDAGTTNAGVTSACSGGEHRRVWPYRTPSPPASGHLRGAQC